MFVLAEVEDVLGDDEKFISFILENVLLAPSVTHNSQHHVIFLNQVHYQSQGLLSID